MGAGVGVGGAGQKNGSDNPYFVEGSAVLLTKNHLLTLKLLNKTIDFYMTISGLLCTQPKT